MSNSLIPKINLSKLLVDLHQFLMTKKWRFWFGLSIAILAIYGIESIKEAFQAEYMIQDDGRQHIFWMRRFLDPELFPQDLIADYFQSVAPGGYKAFYWVAASVGIDPVFLSKLLPIFLGLISTVYCFGVSLQILPIPAVGFFSSLILNQTLWMEDDLVSATPRAFLYPLFLAFLYYLLRRDFFPVLIAIALQGLFYPHTVLLSLTILTLRLFSYQKTNDLEQLDSHQESHKINYKINYFETQTAINKGCLDKYPNFILMVYASKFSRIIRASVLKICVVPFFFLIQHKKRLKLSSVPLNYWLWLGAIIITVAILLPYKFNATEFGPIITVAEAKLQPIFNYVDGRYGRAFFFHENPFIFWLIGPRSGILFLGLLSPLTITSLMLPFLLSFSFSQRTHKFPLAKQVSNKVEILTQILIASIGLFFLAHALLFLLHFPTRYVYHSLRVMIAIAAGIALIIWLDSYLRRIISQIENGLNFQQGISIGCTTLLVVILSIIPFSPDLTLDNQSYIKGKETQLYEYLLAQPKDTLIASISKESDNIPTFAQRSTLVAQQYSLPYHVGYYSQFSQRAIDLIQAQYSPNPEKVRGFINKYGVDFWLLDQTAFDPRYVADKELIIQYDLAEQIIYQLEQNIIPALSATVEKCTVLTTKRAVLLPTSCITNELIKLTQN